MLSPIYLQPLTHVITIRFLNPNPTRLLIVLLLTYLVIVDRVCFIVCDKVKVFVHILFNYCPQLRCMFVLC